MPWLPDAVEAALIAGGVSFASLLITNQSKVSDFRQKWIDGLRDDVTTLVTHALEIHQAKTVEEAAPSFTKVHEATARITLRLNPKEDESKAVTAAMVNVRNTIHSNVSFEQVSSALDGLTSAAQAVLKKEWKRVKSGEPVYKWTFRFILIAVAALVVASVYQNRHFFHL